MSDEDFGFIDRTVLPTGKPRDSFLIVGRFDRQMVMVQTACGPENITIGAIEKWPGKEFSCY